MTARRINESEEAGTSYNVIARKEAHARVIDVVVRRPAVEAFVVVELIGGLCEEDARFKKSFSGDSQNKHVSEHDCVEIGGQARLV
jgi:hypothetical protein